MINQRSAGSASSFCIAVTTEDGIAVAPVSAVWTVRDEDGLDVASGTATVNGTSVEFTIPAQNMVLPAGVSAGGRELEITAQTGTDSIIIQEFFLIVARQPLVRFRNTLVTYTEALAIRHGFGPVLAGWDGADDAMRISALINAFDSLARVTYAVSSLREGTSSKDYAAYGTGSDEIFDMRRAVRIDAIDQARFADLPERFCKAIRRAQMIEADVILGGDEVARVREAGIISETIGESSTFYSSKPFLNLPMSRRTYEVLKPYIVINVSIGR